MIYEGRHAKGINYGLAVAVALLSILGFVAAGVIPSESTRVGGSYPLVGWAIVGACFGETGRSHGPRRESGQLHCP